MMPTEVELDRHITQIKWLHPQTNLHAFFPHFDAGDEYPRFEWDEIETAHLREFLKIACQIVWPTWDPDVRWGLEHRIEGSHMNVRTREDFFAIATRYLGTAKTEQVKVWNREKATIAKGDIVTPARQGDLMANPMEVEAARRVANMAANVRVETFSRPVNAWTFVHQGEVIKAGSVLLEKVLTIEDTTEWADQYTGMRTYKARVVVL